MDESNEQLARELRETIAAAGYKTAFGDEEEQAPAADPVEENPLESDFFKALNAFRAARTRGDASEMAAAEERLRSVVRDELTGGEA